MSRFSGSAGSECPASGPVSKATSAGWIATGSCPAVQTKRFLCGLLLISATAFCGREPDTQSDSDRLAGLKLSQTCADAGAKYSAKWEQNAIGWTVTQQSTHYNRAMNRCFVYMRAGTGRLHHMFVFDPIEQVNFADYMTETTPNDTTVQTCFTTDDKRNQVPCVSDNRLVNVALSVFQLYRDRLMNQ